jgi:hypothetical protein
MRTAICLIPLVLVGCANGFSTFYTSKTGGKPVEELPNLIPNLGPVEVVSRKTTKESVQDMVEEGYSLIGVSSFHGPDESLDGARKKAEQLHAAVVHVHKEYTNSETANIPITTYNTVTTNSTGTVGGTYYSGTSTTTVPETTNYQVTYGMYNYFAAYWVKTKPGIIGAQLLDLSSARREELGRNRGVEVTAVVKAGPAFLADILRGDVIIRLGESEISDRGSATEALRRYAGSKIDVVVLRKGKELTIPVQLRGRPD